MCMRFLCRLILSIILGRLSATQLLNAPESGSPKPSSDPDFGVTVSSLLSWSVFLDATFGPVYSSTIWVEAFCSSREEGGRFRSLPAFGEASGRCLWEPALNLAAPMCWELFMLGTLRSRLFGSPLYRGEEMKSLGAAGPFGIYYLLFWRRWSSILWGWAFVSVLRRLALAYCVRFICY